MTCRILDDRSKITMEDYTQIFYEKTNFFTQGCIIPDIPEFDIKKNENTVTKQIALLIIENACNLETGGGRTPKVSGVEYIMLYDAKDFISRLNSAKTIGSMIQNRKFESPSIYLPPHDMYDSYPQGFIGLCDFSRHIDLTTLNKYKLEEYLCVIPPYRDYIKNKYLYFKLSIPLYTITDDEALKWAQSLIDKRTSS